MKTKIFACFLLGVLFLGLIGYNPTFATDPSEDFEMPAELREKLNDQADALHAYEKLWDSFSKNEQGLPIYPEEYAGEYIEEGKLVLLIVGLNAEFSEKYRQICGDSFCVRFENAEHSLIELESYDNISNELIEEYSLVDFGVDRRNNRYLINVDERDYESVVNVIKSRQLEDIIDVVGISGSAVCCTSYVHGGNEIVNSTTNKGYSSCIGGYYSGYEAILTAGHDNAVTHNFKRDNNHLGQVWFSRCNTTPGDTTINSLGDFSIIIMGGNYIGSSKVRDASTLLPISGYYSSLPTGTTVYKYGAQTGYSWGTVQQASITVQYNSSPAYYIRGLYKSYMQNSTGTNAVYPGDSGGSVYIYDGAYKIHGNVSGCYVPENGGVIHILYSSPIYYAIDPNNVGFTPKTN